MGREIISILTSILLIVASSCFPPNKNKIPELEQSTIYVTTKYPGASPYIIENRITKVIERAVSTIKGVKSVNSVSAEEVATVLIHFGDDTDVDAAELLVSQKMKENSSQLPLEIEPPLVSKNIPSHFCVKIAIYGSEDLTKLSSIAALLKDELYKTSDIKYVETKGNELKEYLNINLNREKIIELGINVRDVSDAMERRNEYTDNSGMVIQVGSQVKDPEELKNILIVVKNQQAIYLKDIATIEMKKDIKEIIRENNQRVITIHVLFYEEQSFEEGQKKIEFVIDNAKKISPAKFSYKISNLH